MRKTIWSPLALSILLLTILLVIWAGAFALPAQYGETFLGELPDKAELLRKTESPRVILIGGSSAAFGVDSALVEEQLPGYSAVNFGLYAALGTRIMLDLALPELREGDIVILSPEQDPQALSMFFGPEALWQAADGNPGLLAAAPLELWPALVSELPGFAMGKWKNLVTGELPQPGGVYVKSSFNEYGDVDNAVCAQNVMSGGYDPNTPIRFDTGLADADFLAYCNVFAASAKGKDAQVYYRFPPMNALAAVGDVDGYAEWLQRELEFPLMGDPNATVLDAGWFYDTNYHLNTAGKIVNTRLLVRDIKAILGDPSPTDIALPTMPNFAENAEFQGDEGDAGYFAGVVVDGAAQLTGLTSAGMERASLTVPAHWGGYPVQSLEAGVFAGNTAVEQITLQENIRRIDDGAFNGCSRLREIRLTSSEPGRCIVGQELLEGTQAEILVPDSALGAYRSHYTWANYAGKIKSWSG